ncbi:hypothetical protein A2215_03950 [Candidatus Berkelbacteria bacterium RIFOXYA2_FULL_43_10]|uniref:Type I restriction modification DNA specificity domain-containing protein n=1 Tax=Candidatus Berkelbacteria bacterium RIFOXYA2_FULL_43_10 TaxID=1797472 RepID=A0A1F5E4E6_9BACT|nr:MAG: hypothetical protein A2215_03950 [Candidatus Berkelbacteria bacterium RIFOXYA2_FULL_43_10]
MNKIKTTQLKNAAHYSDQRVNCAELKANNFVGTDNLLQNKLGKIEANYTPNSGFTTSYSMGDILVANIRPYLNKIWYATNNGGSSADVLTLKVNTNYNSKFVYYSLFRNDFFAHVMKGSKGTKMPRGDKNQVLNFLISDFNLPDQQKIAIVLSALDDKIELNNKINTNLEMMAKTLYDYWFVQFDFQDENDKPYKTNGGKMIWSEELKKKIPEGWEVKSLIDITNVSTESINPFNYPDREFKHYSIPTFDQLGTYGIEKGNAIMSNKFTITKTDVLVSKLNPWFNRVIYSTEENDLISSTEFVIWRSQSINMKNYLYMIARDPSFVAYCTNSAAGTSNSHKRVNPTVMMKYKIAYKKSIAEIFGSKLGPAIKMYAKNQVENKTLTDLRDWLLPMLMNGQVTIK